VLQAEAVLQSAKPENAPYHTQDVAFFVKKKLPFIVYNSTRLRIEAAPL